MAASRTATRLLQLLLLVSGKTLLDPASSAAVASPAGRLPDVIVFPPPGTFGSASQSASTQTQGGLDALSSPLNSQLSQRGQAPLSRAAGALRGVATRLRTLVAPAAEAEGSGGNLLLSPLSVAAALGQLLLGARGETRLLLADLLDAPGPTGVVPEVALGGEPLVPDLDYHLQFKALLRLLASPDDAPPSAVELRVASAFFAQRGLPLREDFRHALHDLYRADVRPLDFRERPSVAASAVNEWARRATRGRIPTVLASPLPPSTAALVASAVYFRGAWQTPFDPEFTSTGWFRLGPRRRVAARFMRQNFPELRYYDASPASPTEPGYRLVVLPYKGGQTAMYVALPNDKEADVRSFAAALTLEGMMAAARNARPTPVSLVLPRMNIAGSFSLKEPLRNLQKNRRLPRSAPEPRYQVSDSLPMHVVVPLPDPDVTPLQTSSPPSDSLVDFEGESGERNSTPGMVFEELVPVASAPASLGQPVVVGVPLRILEAEESFDSPKGQAQFYYHAKEPSSEKTNPDSPQDSSDLNVSGPVPVLSRKSVDKSSKTVFSAKDHQTPFPKMVLGDQAPYYSSDANSPGRPKASNIITASSLSKIRPALDSSDRGNCTATAEMSVSDSTPGGSGTQLLTKISVRSPPAPLTSSRGRSEEQVSSNHILTARSDFDKTSPREKPRAVATSTSTVSTSPNNSTSTSTLPSTSGPSTLSSSLMQSSGTPSTTVIVPLAGEVLEAQREEETEVETDAEAEVEVDVPEGAERLNALSVGVQGPHGVRPRPVPAGVDKDVVLDLTGASNTTLRVSDALHYVWIEVTETGTEAAAVTASVVDYSGDSQLFVVNRPFVTAIVHEPTGALLFWASVSDPTGGAGIRVDDPAPAQLQRQRPAAQAG